MSVDERSVWEEDKGSAGERYAIQAALKTLDVLFTFRRARGPLTLSKIAAQLSLTRNQVYRCLKSLEVAGLVDEEEGGFILTPKLLEFVPSLRRQTLYPLAEGTMRLLRERTGETVDLYLFVPPFEAVCAITFITLNAVGVRSEMGERYFLNAGAAPKALLAHLPEAQQERVLAEVHAFPQYTGRTCRDPEALRQEIRAIRARGYALSDGECEEDELGVGAAVLRPSGQPVAAVSVRGPSSRITERNLGHLGMMVEEAARDISRRIAHADASPA